MVQCTTLGCRRRFETLEDRTSDIGKSNCKLCINQCGVQDCLAETGKQCWNSWQSISRFSVIQTLQ